MTDQSRRAAAEEIETAWAKYVCDMQAGRSTSHPDIAAILARHDSGTVEDLSSEEIVRRDREENWPEDRHDTATVGETAEWFAGEIVAVTNGVLAARTGLDFSVLEGSELSKIAVKHIAGIIQSAISASERELVEALESLRYYVGNPSAWDHYSENVSEAISAVLAKRGQK